jgi:hypothetical protein
MKFNIVFIFIVVTCLSCNNNAVKIINKVGLQSDTFQFGTINYSDTLREIYFLTNKTNADTRIMSIENGCGCTSVLLKDSIIKKNDSLPLQIMYIPKRVDDSGAVEKYLTLRTNAANAFINIIVKGYVKK